MAHSAHTRVVDEYVFVTCAPTSGEGDTEGACATRDEGVAISSAEMAGPTLVTGQEADFLDAHFAVGLATTQVLDGESLGCCDEGDLTAVRVLIVAGRAE